MDEILNFLPEILKQKIISSNMNNVEEIRIRTAKPVILKSNIDEKVLDYITTTEWCFKYYKEYVTTLCTHTKAR